MDYKIADLGIDTLIATLLADVIKIVNSTVIGGAHESTT